MIAYRKAEAGDAVALARMARASFSHTFGHLYARADLEEFLDRAFGPNGLPAQINDPRYHIRLAMDGTQIAGFAKIGPNAFAQYSKADAIELYQLYILPDWHGTGIAQTLMEWAISEARTQGAPQIVLSVYVDNHRAKAFYARYGMREVGRYAFKVGETIDDDRIWVLDL